VANIPLAFALAAVMEVQLRHVTKRFHKAACEHRRFDCRFPVSYRLALPPAQFQKRRSFAERRVQFALRSPAIWLWTCSLNFRGFWIFWNTSGVPPVPRTITVP